VFRLLASVAISTLLVLAPGVSRGAAPAAAGRPLVFAAASLQEALAEAAEAFAADPAARPLLSFAASSALARQIEAGAPAELFISADEEWMDYLEQRGRLQVGTRRAWLSNRLVLVAPASDPVQIRLLPGVDLLAALRGGRLAMADPASVPAGRYARAALVTLGAWEPVAARLASADNVRAALALVERGEAPLGIVYATDALVSNRARLVDTFPADSHPPISYPVALLGNGANAQAAAFYRFLLSAEGTAVFLRRGFTAAR
jgi:molybdate transport system substrate-binding protein